MSSQNEPYTRKKPIFMMEARFSDGTVYEKIPLGTQNLSDALAQVEEHREYKKKYPTRGSLDPFTATTYHLMVKPGFWDGEWEEVPDRF